MSLLVAMVLFGLLPFLGKPVHLDDPLFVWTAQQIHAHPTDFYGFDVNWYGFELPMSQVNKNPPIAAYYIAAVATLTGFNEIALHAAFLIPNLALVLGTYALARRLCGVPLFCALAAFATPAMMVCATTLMCDTMMLAFWCWAISAWLAGLERDRFGCFLLAGVLITLSALTKYFGACLIPLLLVYTLVVRGRPGWWLLGLLLPVIALIGYELYTRDLYGVGLLLDAPAYAQERRGLAGFRLVQVGLAVVYLGGTVLTQLLFAPLLWSPRALIVAGVATLAGLCGLYLLPSILSFRMDVTNPVRWHVPIHVALFAAAAAQVLALVALDLRRRRDASSLLLVLWVAGTFCFAAFFNWAVNVRSLLSAVPAIAILLGRRLEDRRLTWLKTQPVQVLQVIVPALLISMFVAWGDYCLARSQQAAAVSLAERYIDASDPLWFEGHWGFQYYMQQRGGRCVEFAGGRLLAGQIVIIPSDNTNLFFFPRETMEPVDQLESPTASWITTLRTSLGINFHMSQAGILLPYAFMTVPAERYYVIRLLQDIGLHPDAEKSEYVPPTKNETSR